MQHDNSLSTEQFFEYLLGKMALVYRNESSEDYIQMHVYTRDRWEKSIKNNETLNSFPIPNKIKKVSTSER